MQNQGGYQNNFVDVFLHCVSRSVSEVCSEKKYLFVKSEGHSRLSLSQEILLHAPLKQVADEHEKNCKYKYHCWRLYCNVFNNVFMKILDRLCTLCLLSKTMGFSL